MTKQRLGIKPGATDPGYRCGFKDEYDGDADGARVNCATSADGKHLPPTTKKYPVKNPPLPTAHYILTQRWISTGLVFVSDAGMTPEF